MNSLIANYTTSSDSNSTDSSDSEDNPQKSNKNDTENHGDVLPKPKLPTPNFGSDDNATSTQTSVFKNPFSEAEISKEAVLQKHVRMVENKDNIITINGKKICWNYRKGRCRFGHNCKFAHDSDIEITKEQLDNKNSGNPINNQTNYIKVKKDLVNDSEDAPVRKKSKRPGLTQGLIPGKKVMKQYLNNQKN